ncbi:MMPL family transporter [Streptomyces noursei]|uniref:MMPL family transporter n=1 Tax=Streptomyces noursei TaxID=1971 RepID=UPI00167A545B|nr:MMPL family transporter [Streptomyces noursei]MCZ1014693.1 MMPL family transporter [Streptomyces noursei]GGW96952.1 membrane protein [Streptomyces noursei]
MNRVPWVVRLARATATRPGVVVHCWLLVAVLAVLQIPSFTEHETPRTARVEGSESARAEDLLSSAFPHLGPEVGGIVFHSPTLTADDPRYRTAVAAVALSVQADPAVQRTVSPFSVAGRVSKDGRTALTGVFFRGSKGDVQRAAPRLQELVRRSTALVQRGGERRIEAYLVGYSAAFSEIITQEKAGTRQAELIGVPLALLLLLLATGTAVAACVPIVLAAAGVLLSFGVVGAVSRLTGFDATLETIIPMMGLALGIDYALYVVSRFRAELAERRVDPATPSPEVVRDAVAAAMRHAGTTIAASGLVFMLGMSGLLFIDAPTIRQIGVGAMIAAACTLLAGLTLLPALLALAGHRLEYGRLPWRSRVPGSLAETGSPRFAAFAQRVMARPVAVTVLAAALLGVLALPTLDLRLGVDLGVPALKGTAVGKGQRLMERGFAPGRSMPIDLVYTCAGGRLSQRDLDAVDRLSTRLARDPAVYSVDSVTTLAQPGQAPVRATPDTLRATAKHVLVSADSRSTVLSVAPAAASDSAAAMQLVGRLRTEIIPGALADVPGARVLVGGMTAAHRDLSDETTGKLWPVLGFILGLSFVFLVAVFRSILVPVKALLMNVLATLAAYGVTVWVFQFGHLEGPLDFRSTGTIQAFLPLLTFAFLFAVSMDYELFLVRRVQESWRRSGDNSAAVVEGVAHTAVPITAAAATMAAVFGSFVMVDVLEIKQIGFALAVAVLLDVTLVRMLLVPAVMRLAGRVNWWFPRWGLRRRAGREPW